MKSYKKLNINAGIWPHPLDEDSDVEEDFYSDILGYISGETEDGEPSYFNEKNLELFDRIENFLAERCRKGAQRMWPLLNDLYFRTIYVSADVAFGSYTASLAGYSPNRSMPEKGVYSFTVKRRLFDMYNAYLQGATDTLPDSNIWEHEFVHLLDHSEILKGEVFRNSDIPQNNLTYYILNYREEGIANLLDLLDGNLKGVGSINEAKTLFAERCDKVRSVLSTTDSTTPQIRESIYSGYHFYEIGPWIILDMLREIPMVTDLISIETLEQQIVDGEDIPESLKLEIIRNAFYIDVEWFLSRTKNQQILTPCLT
jgi:hypothetical protein